MADQPMTNLPEMTPSAEERLSGYTDTFKVKFVPFLETAFRDGALAELVRIVAMLREPTEATIDWLADLLIDHGSPAEDDVRAVLLALADRIAAEGERHDK